MLMNRIDAREAAFLAQVPAFIGHMTEQHARGVCRDQAVEQCTPDALTLMLGRHDEHAERGGAFAELPGERGADERALRIDGGKAAAETCGEAPVVGPMPPFDGHGKRMPGGDVVERESPVFDHIALVRVGHAGLLTLKTITVTVTPRR